MRLSLPKKIHVDPQKSQHSASWQDKLNDGVYQKIERDLQYDKQTRDVSPNVGIM